MGETVSIKGYIDNFKFRSAENGYGVFVLVTEDMDEGEVICTGLSRGMEKGDYVELDGEMVEHPSYGPQFKYNRYTILPDISAYMNARPGCPRRYKHSAPQGFRQQSSEQSDFRLPLPR